MCYAGDHGTAYQVSSLADIDHQPEVSSENESHVFDNVEQDTIQESQNEMAAEEESQAEIVMPEGRMFLDSNLTVWLQVP